MPSDRRVLGRFARIPHGGGPCAVRLSPRAALERAFKRYHPVRRSDPCRHSLHDRVHRRREIRLSKAVSDAHERHAIHSRKRDRRGGLGRACARARNLDGARDLYACVFPDGGLRRVRGGIKDPGHRPALLSVLPLRCDVGKRRASLLVAHAERVPGVRRAVHLLLCFDHPAGALLPHDVHAEPQELSHHAGRVAARGQERGADAVHARAHFAARLLYDRADGAKRRQAAEAPLRGAELLAKAA